MKAVRSFILIIITYLTTGAISGQRIDVTFLDEDLLALNGPIYKYNTEAVELLHHFEQSFLAAGNSLLEPCDREHHLKMEEIRNRQNSQINLLSLPIELARLGGIMNTTWNEVKKTSSFCKFHPFWKREQIDLTCDERSGTCCSVSQGKGRGGGCGLGSHLRKDRYYLPPTTTTTVRPSTRSALTTATAATTPATAPTTTMPTMPTATPPKTTETTTTVAAATLETTTTVTPTTTDTTTTTIETATTVAPPTTHTTTTTTETTTIITPSATTTAKRTTTDTSYTSQEILYTGYTPYQPMAPESPGGQLRTKSPASLITPVVNPLILLVLTMILLVVTI